MAGVRQTIEGTLDQLSGYASSVKSRVFGAGIPDYIDWLRQNLPVLSPGKPLNPDLPHCIKIIERVQAIVDGTKRFVMIMSPPRHGKTLFGTQLAAIWCALRRPGCNILVLAHTAERGEQVSREMREFALALGLLDPTSTALTGWKLMNGSMISFKGAGQPLHGYNADFIFVDDPIRDQEDADSDGEREKIWKWFNASVLLRLMDHTTIVFIYTTAHYDDLGQRIMKTNTMGWELLRMPCQSEGEGDPLGRAEGVFLSERSNRKLKAGEMPDGLFRRVNYEMIRHNYMSNGNEYIWWSHYQCRPGAPTGMVIHPERILLINEDQIEAIGKESRAYDFASSTGKKSDMTVGARGGLGSVRDHSGAILTDMLIVRHIMHGKWDPGTRDAMVQQTAWADGPDVFTRLPRDPGEAGVRSEHSLSQLLSGFSYQFKTPGNRSKTKRCDELASAVNRCKVAMVRGEYVDEALRQLREFPDCNHDDFPDALADLHAEVVLAPLVRFAFDDALHVYNTDFFEAGYGGYRNEIHLLSDPELFSRWGSFVFSTSNFVGSWLLFLAKSFDGTVFVYDELMEQGTGLEVQAGRIKAKCDQWRWPGVTGEKPKPIYCQPSLNGTDASDGISRWSKFSQLGLPMFVGRDDPIEGWASVESLLSKDVGGEPGLLVHERCKFLRAYLSSTPRDPRRPEDVDATWVGRPCLDALRLGVHTLT